MKSTKSKTARAAKAVARSKRITFTVPAKTVAYLESLAKACDIPTETMWRAIRKDAANMVTDEQGIWANPSNFSDAWHHGTPARVRRVAKRLSLISQGEYVRVKGGGIECCYFNGKPYTPESSTPKPMRAVVVELTPAQAEWILKVARAMRCTCGDLMTATAFAWFNSWAWDNKEEIVSTARDALEVYVDNRSVPDREPNFMTTGFTVTAAG